MSSISPRISLQYCKNKNFSGQASAAVLGGAMVLMLMLMDSPMPGLQIGGIAKRLAWRRRAAPACPYVLHLHVIYTCNIDKNMLVDEPAPRRPVMLCC